MPSLRVYLSNRLIPNKGFCSLCSQNAFTCCICYTSSTCFIQFTRYRYCRATAAASIKPIICLRSSSLRAWNVFSESRLSRYFHPLKLPNLSIHMYQLTFLLHLSTRTPSLLRIGLETLFLEQYPVCTNGSITCKFRICNDLDPAFFAASISLGALYR